MRLSVRHLTRYIYQNPVSTNQNEVRLRPATRDPKRLEFSLLKISPPTRLRHFRDSFQNYVQWFEINEPHTELTIESISHVQTTSQYGPNIFPLGVTFKDISPAVIPDMLRPYLTPSRYIDADIAFWKLALDACDSETDVFLTAQNFMRFIFENWTYSSNTTSVHTRALDILDDRRGVCQDFTHLMIAMCRSLQIPARYVSGYLYNGPGDTLRGHQASHAWCEVWLPSHGWFGLDPTNNQLADDRYIKIATGRDYDDAAPLKGNFKGPHGTRARLEVTVSVDIR